MVQRSAATGHPSIPAAPNPTIPDHENVQLVDLSQRPAACEVVQNPKGKKYADIKHDQITEHRVEAENETAQRLRPLGKYMIYTEESYKAAHDGRSYKEDGLKLIESLVRNGRNPKHVIMVWEGPRDVWQLEEEDVARVKHKHTLDDGADVFLDGQQDMIFQDTVKEMMGAIDTAAVKSESDIAKVAEARRLAAAKAELQRAELQRAAPASSVAAASVTQEDDDEESFCSSVGGGGFAAGLGTRSGMPKRPTATPKRATQGVAGAASSPHGSGDMPPPTKRRKSGADAAGSGSPAQGLESEHAEKLKSFQCGMLNPPQLQKHLNELTKQVRSGKDLSGNLAEMQKQARALLDAAKCLQKVKFGKELGQDFLRATHNTLTEATAHDCCQWFTSGMKLSGQWVGALYALAHRRYDEFFQHISASSLRGATDQIESRQLEFIEYALAYLLKSEASPAATALSSFAEAVEALSAGELPEHYSNPLMAIKCIVTHRPRAKLPDAVCQCEADRVRPLWRKLKGEAFETLFNAAVSVSKTDAMSSTFAEQLASHITASCELLKSVESERASANTLEQALRNEQALLRRCAIA